MGVECPSDFGAVLFTFRENYAIIVLLRYLIDKLEFDGEEL